MSSSSLKKSSFFRLVPAAILSLAALIGMIDAFYLVLEYLSVLLHPGEPTPCTVNTLISCTKTVQGPWSHYFSGIPNPMLGMLWYSGFLAYGVTRLLGAEYSRKSRAFVSIVLLLGVAFSYRLYLASVLQLAGVCPFCLTSTTVSTLIILAFFVDDALYVNRLLSLSYRWVLTLFQIFSVIVFAVGLPWFIGWNLQWIPQPMEVIHHWSFSVMVLLVCIMIAGHVWAFRRLRRSV